MKNNFSHLIKTEMVKRFEDLIKQQITENELLVKNFQMNMDSLHKDFIDLAKNLQNIKTNHTNLYQDTQNKFIHEKKELENSFENQRVMIREWIKNIKSYIENDKKQNSEYAIKKDILDQCELLNSKIEKYQVFFDREIRDINNALAENLHEYESKLAEVQKEHEKKEKNVCELIQNLDTKINTQKNHCEGVLKEIQIYKKRVYIIEKKIENLYMLIERLKGC